MSVIICNNASINLNFLIKVLSIYNKKEINLRNVLLDRNELNHNIECEWNKIINSFEYNVYDKSNKSFIKWDKNLVDNKELYSTLFQNTKEGYAAFMKIWEEYHKWWYTKGQNIINKKTDEIIPEIYDLVNKKMSEKDIKVNGVFGIQVVFNEVPEQWIKRGPIFTIESIDNFSDKSKIDEVAERLYKLISSFDSNNELILNLDKLHTTELGVKRIKKNLSLETDDVVKWCKNKIKSKSAEITRNGKNWYISVEGYIITVNAYSYTIITAHKEK